MILLPCFYNAPISYFALIHHSDKTLLIEVYDHYVKQTYRNRCRILGGNGVIDLSIPVIKKHGSKTYVKDISPDYSSNWNRIHWKSIKSAYASSPFFEFMKDLFIGFYEREYKYLVDLNLELLLEISKILEWNITVKNTSQYEHTPECADFRESIHPKRRFSHESYTIKPASYHQVFEERHGFKNDLSILDLLFNEGPNASTVLSNSLHYNK